MIHLIGLFRTQIGLISAKGRFASLLSRQPVSANGPHVILWSGGTPSPVAVSLCEKRDLEMRAVDAVPSPETMAQAKGLILRWPQPIDASIISALQHGLVPVLLCDFSDIPAAGQAIEALVPGKGKTFILMNPILTERSARSHGKTTHPLGVPMSTQSATRVSTRRKGLLLMRAFGDCSRVQIVPELGGSGHVFQAYARLRDSRAGPIAMPFFVKFGQRATIERELRNYRECTTLHVPFNQRPNVDLARCALGFASGIIVGNYVERSESLQVVADRGAGPRTSSVAFNSALRGWRQQAHIEGSANVRTAKLAEEMSRCLPSTTNGAATRDWNATSKWREEILVRPYLLPISSNAYVRFQRSIFLVAIAHNDLHGENVQVRDGMPS